MKKNMFLAMALLAFMAMVLPAQTGPGMNWTVLQGTGNGGGPFGTSVVSAIAFGNNVFVAVGASGKTAWSVDGRAWTAVTVGNSMFTTVAFGNGRFLAATNQGEMHTSTDGRAWTPIPGISSMGSGRINAIAFGDGRWVAVGSNGRVAYSTNSSGTEWIRALNFPFRNENVVGVAFGNNRWVIITTNYVAYSTNGGVNWTAPTSVNLNFDGADAYHKFLTFANNIFIVSGTRGADRGGDVGAMWYSREGINWTAVPDDRTSQGLSDGRSVFLVVVNGVAYGANRWVAVENGGERTYSADGMNWIRINEPTRNWHAGYKNLNAVVFGNGRFVAVGESGLILYTE